jgi:uncharacterized protein
MWLTAFDVELAVHEGCRAQRRFYVGGNGLSKSMARYLVCGVIRLYQLVISPVLPPSCRFYPSCSTYAIQAITRYGVWRGLHLTGWRLLRCHPFHPGGWDPVR